MALLLVGVGVIWLVHRAGPEDPKVSQQIPSTNVLSPPTPATIPSEIRIADFMLQPRAKIEAVLGKPVKSSECSDSTGRQFEYSDGSYLCVDHGIVILLSYELHGTPSNVDDALSAVGLHTTLPPFVAFGVANIWSVQRGNPLKIGRKYAHQVTVLVGRVNSVEIDLTGGEAMPPDEPAALPVDAKNRIAFGKLIQTTFQTEGRRMAVRATGENFETLELSSGLIFEGSHTLDAAREAVDPEMLKMLMHLKFKRVLIKGTESGFSESYLVQ